MSAVPSTRHASSTAAEESLPSWVVGLCGVAAVASLMFSILMFLYL